VGVKALFNNVNYTLMMTGPKRFEVSYTLLPQSVWMSKTFPNPNNEQNNS